MPRPLSSTRTAAVGQQRDRDAVQKPAIASSTALSTTSQIEVVETRQTGGSDAHSRPFSDRVETFQNLDVFGRVIGCWLVGVRTTRAPQSIGRKACLTCSFIGDIRAGFLRFSCCRDRLPSYRMGVTQRRQSGSVSRAIIRGVRSLEPSNADGPRSSRSWRAATSSNRCLQRRLQEAQLRRPGAGRRLRRRASCRRVSPASRGWRRHRPPPPPSDRRHRPSGSRSGSATPNRRTHRCGSERTTAVEAVAESGTGSRLTTIRRMPASIRKSRPDAQLPEERRRSSARLGPGGRCRSSASQRLGSSSLNTSSSTSTGALPTLSVTRRCAPSRSASANVRCSPCDACGARRHAVDQRSRRSSRCGPTTRHSRRTSSPHAPRPSATPSPRCAPPRLVPQLDAGAVDRPAARRPRRPRGARRAINTRRA